MWTEFILIYICNVYSSLNIVNINLADCEVGIDEKALFTYNVYRLAFYAQKKSYADIVIKYFKNKEKSEYIICTIDFLLDVLKTPSFYIEDSYYENYILNPLTLAKEENHYYIPFMDYIPIKESMDEKTMFLFLKRVIDNFIMFSRQCICLNNDVLSNINRIVKQNHKDEYFKYKAHEIENLSFYQFNKVKSNLNFQSIKEFNGFLQSLSPNLEYYAINFNIHEYYFKLIFLIMSKYIDVSELKKNDAEMRFKFECELELAISFIKEFLSERLEALSKKLYDERIYILKEKISENKLIFGMVFSFLWSIYCKEVINTCEIISKDQIVLSEIILSRFRKSKIFIYIRSNGN